MKVLFLGEIVGIPAVKQIRKKITKIIEKYHIDFVIANGDGASDGYGILAETASELLDCGINVVTGGDLIFRTLLKSIILYCVLQIYQRSLPVEVMAFL